MNLDNHAFASLPARIELGMMVAQALIELKYSGEGILP
jgi:hypothetical protein